MQRTNATGTLRFTGGAAQAFTTWPSATSVPHIVKNGAGTVTAQTNAWQAYDLTVNNGTLIYDSSAAQTNSGVISGGGALINSGSGALTLAGKYADRLVLLHAGRLIEAGAPELVLTEENLARHYGARVRVLRDNTGALVVVPDRPARARPDREAAP